MVFVAAAMAGTDSRVEHPDHMGGRARKHAEAVRERLSDHCARRHDSEWS